MTTNFSYTKPEKIDPHSWTKFEREFLQLHQSSSVFKNLNVTLDVKNSLISFEPSNREPGGVFFVEKSSDKTTLDQNNSFTADITSSNDDFDIAVASTLLLMKNMIHGVDIGSNNEDVWPKAVSELESNLNLNLLHINLDNNQVKSVFLSEQGSFIRTKTAWSPQDSIRDLLVFPNKGINAGRKDPDFIADITYISDALQYLINSKSSYAAINGLLRDPSTANILISVGDNLTIEAPTEIMKVLIDATNEFTLITGIEPSSNLKSELDSISDSMQKNNTKKRSI
jgi:hypothetical protein